MSALPLPPRPPMVNGRPSRHGPPPNLDGMSLEQITQRALDISRAGLRYAPVAGPALDMADDLRDGNYGAALFNGAMLAADLTPIGPARRVVKIIDGINDMRRGAFLARAATQTQRVRKIENVGKGYEVHHTIPMGGGKFVRGESRKTEGLLRNHPANLKVMDKTTHRRLTGDWTDPATGEVLKQFNAAQRAWHGTNALQKTTAAAAAATAADWGENIARDLGKPANPRRR